jgi:hypothetical protein
MVRLPPSVRTQIAKANLELFAASAAARELDDQAAVWTVVEWSWTAGPPMRIVLRSDHGETTDFILDASGVWRMGREPIEPKIKPPGDIGVT